MVLTPESGSRARRCRVWRRRVRMRLDIDSQRDAVAQSNVTLELGRDDDAVAVDVDLVEARLHVDAAAYLLPRNAAGAVSINGTEGCHISLNRASVVVGFIPSDAEWSKQTNHDTDSYSVGMLHVTPP